MKGNDFTFDSAEKIHYKYHKVNFKCSGSYIDHPNRIKTKKATINPTNEDDKCFQCATVAALNYEESVIQKEIQVLSHL